MPNSYPIPPPSEYARHKEVVPLLPTIASLWLIHYMGDPVDGGSKRHAAAADHLPLGDPVGGDSGGNKGALVPVTGSLSTSPC